MLAVHALRPAIWLDWNSAKPLSSMGLLPCRKVKAELEEEAKAAAEAKLKAEAGGAGEARSRRAPENRTESCPALH